MATRQKILLILLGLTAAYYFYDLFGSDDKSGISGVPVVKSVPDVIVPKQNESAQPTRSAVLTPGNASLSIKFVGEWGEDPFYKPDYIELLTKSSDGRFVEIDQLDSSFILTGIVEEWAIIGGDIYEINSEVNGYALTEIGEEHVILTMGNSKLRLELGGNKTDER